MKKTVLNIILLAMLTACSQRVDLFTAPVEMVKEPDDAIDLTMEKIETDELYSEFFAVYDSLLISSRPNTTDKFFYVADLKNDSLLGEFFVQGQAPDAYHGLAPINRIERRGDDLVALTYEPVRHELLEWNITKSLETGRDSMLLLGNYLDPKEAIFTYSAMYRIGDSKYVGYTSGVANSDPDLCQLPTYWILDGEEIAPNHGISVYKGMIYNEESDIGNNQLAALWSLSPDKKKIVAAMFWLEQINTVNLENGEVRSYRVEGSVNEDILYSTMRTADRQYLDVVCDDNRIYALYAGELSEAYREAGGVKWLHVFDWNGNFEKKYRLPVPIYNLWYDQSTGTLYGYSEYDAGLYRFNL